jgi:TetR/AcrR family transcriptional regulator, cholesterol catabolism regulator
MAGTDALECSRYTQHYGIQSPELARAPERQDMSAQPSRPEGAKRQRRREKIYEDAIATFNRKGYEATSVSEIAEMNGLLKGSLYYYIESKEDLLVDIFAQTDREFLALIDETLARDMSEIDRLRSFARAWCMWYIKNIGRSRVYVNDWTHLTGERRRRQAEMRRVYGRKVQELVDRAMAELGLEPRFDPEITRRYIFSAVNGLPLWYRADGPAKPEDIADAYGELVVGTILSAYASPPQPDGSDPSHSAVS